MASFSHQYHNFNSLVLNNHHLNNTMYGFLEEQGGGNMIQLFYPSHDEFFYETNLVNVNGGSNQSSTCLDEYHSSKDGGGGGTNCSSDNENSSATKKQSPQSSTTLVHKIEIGEQQVTQKIPKRKNRTGSRSTNPPHTKGDKEGKSKKLKKNINSEMKKLAKVDDQEPPTGYIHVRARRGQATDSHSLAERVRREKISERMRTLQRLVPGCDKVNGKAMMLDEIINYVQSLQNQVEFLSMKLASTNPMLYEFGMEFDTSLFTEGMRMTSTPQPQPQPQPQPSPTASFATFNNYSSVPLHDSSDSLINQHGQRTNAFCQENSNVLWDIEEQRQKFLNPTGFVNNLCSFQ